MKNRLILVDGSSYLFRAYHALPALTNSKGLNTGAAKGVIGMIRKLAADFSDDQLVVVFDAKGPPFAMIFTPNTRQIAHPCRRSCGSKLSRYTTPYAPWDCH